MDIVITILASILIVPIVLFTSGVIRVFLGLLYLLVFPGYTLMLLLYPRKNDWDIIKRLVLSVGLSLAIIPITGILLNFLPWGISLVPITLTLFIFILFFSIFALYRRKRIPADERFQLHINEHIVNWQNKKKKQKISIIITLLCIIILMGVTGYISQTPKSNESFTEFYILGEEGKASDYPRNVNNGETYQVTVGIINKENIETKYQIKLFIENFCVGQTEVIDLKTEETWEHFVPFVVNGPAGENKLDISLFRGNEQDPVYSLHIYLIISEQ